MRNKFDELQNGVVLAELGGHGTGPYCAKHGQGGALVMLGTYIIDSGDDVPYPAGFVFKPGRENYGQYLKEDVQAARGSGAKVGVSAISVKLGDTVDFCVASQEAGADYVSLCAISSMDMFVSQGLGRELPRKANRDKLKSWVSEILDAINIPFIFKIRVIDEPDAAETVSILSDMGVEIIHAVCGSETGSGGLVSMSEIAKRCEFLIGGGGVVDVESAKRILSTGAGAVAVASAAMKDATFLGRLQSGVATFSVG